MAILIIDGHNFMHRAKSGFQLGPYNIVYNFFRSLKSLIEQMKPTRVYFALEGRPKHRYDLFPEYKANRLVEEGSEKHKSKEDFMRQVDLIVDLLKHFPVSIVRHKDFEADDTIYNLVSNASSWTEWIVVSTDSDFIQLLQDVSKSVKLYNPVSKTYVEAPQDYSYVYWKALRGDPSDNIPGLPGVGDKVAEDAQSDPDMLERLLNEGTNKEQFQRNCDLISFKKWSAEEMFEMELNGSPKHDWDAVKKQFESWAFKSLLKEEIWSKFQLTFDPLWATS